MQPVSGQLLARRSWDPMVGGQWVDVLTGQHVRMELRETTLAAEDDTERVRQAARAARTGGITADEAARLFGQRYGGRWRVADPGSW